MKIVATSGHIVPILRLVEVQVSWKKNDDYLWDFTSTYDNENTNRPGYVLQLVQNKEWQKREGERNKTKQKEKGGKF